MAGLESHEEKAVGCAGAAIAWVVAEKVAAAA